MKIRKFIIHNSLFIILLVAAVLRLWNLGGNPPHLTPDEAALGYNAYSILKTARDEYGEFLPIFFKSFGDYKPGLYVYLTVPFVAILGLNEFAVRLPNALAGVIAVWLLYLISKELFTGKKFGIWNLEFGIWPAILLAVNPWHIHFSRGAWEANVSLTLTLMGVYFFLKSLKTSKFLVLSSLFFSLTLITYQGAKLSTAIVVGILFLVFWKEFWSRHTILARTVLVSILIGLIFTLPVLLSFYQGKTGRLGIFSIFTWKRPEPYLQNILSQGDEKVGDLTYYPFHSESLNTARGILGRWLNHFSGRFLFFEGDWQNPRHFIPNHGMLLLADLILLILGLITLIKGGLKKDSSNSSGRGTLFILLWLVLAPMPAALSRDQVHAVRALNMIVPVVLISSFGIVKITKNFRGNYSLGKTVGGYNRNQPVGLISFKHPSSSFIQILGFGSLYLASFIYVVDAYFVHLPKHNSKYWDYGYKQIVEAVTPIQKNYKLVRVQQSFAQPYIYFLFYQKYDPVKYQKQAKFIESEYKGDVGYIEKLDNICFCPIDWSVNRGDIETLFVADTIRIPVEDSNDQKNFNVIRDIKYPDGIYTAFRVVEVKQ